MSCRTEYAWVVYATGPIRGEDDGQRLIEGTEWLRSHSTPTRFISATILVAKAAEPAVTRPRNSPRPLKKF